MDYKDNYVDNRTKKEYLKDKKEFYRGISGLTKLDNSRRIRITNDEISIQQQINSLNEEKYMYRNIGGHKNSYVTQQSIIDRKQKELDKERKAFDLEYEEATLKYKKLLRDGQ